MCVCVCVLWQCRKVLMARGIVIPFDGHKCLWICLHQVEGRKVSSVFRPNMSKDDLDCSLSMNSYQKAPKKKGRWCMMPAGQSEDELSSFFFVSVLHYFSPRTNSGHFIVLRCSLLWQKYDNMWPSYLFAWDDTRASIKIEWTFFLWMTSIFATLVTIIASIFIKLGS